MYFFSSINTLYILLKWHGFGKRKRYIVFTEFLLSWLYWVKMVNAFALPSDGHTHICISIYICFIVLICVLIFYLIYMHMCCKLYLNQKVRLRCDFLENIQKYRPHNENGELEYNDTVMYSFRSRLSLRVTVKHSGHAQLVIQKHKPIVCKSKYCVQSLSLLERMCIKDRSFKTVIFVLVRASKMGQIM